MECSLLALPLEVLDQRAAEPVSCGGPFSLTIQRLLQSSGLVDAFSRHLPGLTQAGSLTPVLLSLPATPL